MNPMNILIVEDQFIAIKYLEDILISRESVSIENIYTATNTTDALELFKEHHIDLVFMDINIDGSTDGITCAKLLNKQKQTPIIFTTAYKDSNTIKEANETNLYGYLTKPFKPSDVEANLLITLKMIENTSRKSSSISRRKNKNIIKINNYHYNLQNKTLLKDNQVMDITNKEILLIDVFFNNMNQNLSYDMLREKVWNRNELSDSTIRDAVSRLKKKVDGLVIENIPRFGYILKKG